MRYLLTVIAFASLLPAQITASMRRVDNPLTRQPTDIWVDLDHPDVFWNVTPTGDLEVFWRGDSSRLWMLRDASLFRPPSAQVLGIDVVDAAYLLEPGDQPSGRIRVINEIDCGHFTTAAAVPMPGLPGAHRVAPNVLPGWFGASSCARMEVDSLRVFACEWSALGSWTPPPRPQWSYVRLRFQW
jgi:hypothetical protein